MMDLFAFAEAEQAAPKPAPKKVENVNLRPEAPYQITPERAENCRQIARTVAPRNPALAKSYSDEASEIEQLLAARNIAHDQYTQDHQACGAECDVHAWEEHDNLDRPTKVLVMLCESCSDSIIEPHPRLYAKLSDWGPYPGAMPCCANCLHREGLVCNHPDLKANGGVGLNIAYYGSTMHIDGVRNARRFGEWVTIYSKQPECHGQDKAVMLP